jgi:hypothetical protein
MDKNTSDLDGEGYDEEWLTCEVTDVALESASSTYMAGAPTLMHSSYCFTCHYKSLVAPFPSSMSAL